MKTTIKILLAILLGLWLSTQSYSQKQTINLKAHTPDSSTYVKAKGLNIDTMSIDEIIKTVVAVKNEANALKDSISKQAITINGMKIEKPTDSNKSMWINYLLGLFAILIVWSLSFVKGLSQSKILLLKRLGTEASSGIKKIQAICGSISAIIPTVLATTTLPATIVSDLNIVEIICLTITGFSCFLVKDASKLDTTAKVTQPTEVSELRLP